MAKNKFTANITLVFEAEDYPKAQTWLIEQLSKDSEETNMNIQRLDLVRWTNIQTQRPLEVVVDGEED